MRLLRPARPPSTIGYSTRTVTKNVLSQVLTFGLAMTTGAVAAMLVARAYGRDGLGVFLPAWQLAITLSLVALLGVDQWTIRKLTRDEAIPDLESALTLACLLGVLFGGIAAVGPALAGADPAVARSFAVTGAYVAISAPAIVLRFSFHAQERMEVETLAILVEAVVALVAVPIVIASGKGPPWVIAALGIGRLANLAFALRAARHLWGRLRARFEFRRWPSVLKTSIPLGISFSFTTMVLRFDVVLVGLLLPAREAGVYGAAAIATFAIPMIMSSVNRSLYPILARARTLEHPELREVFAFAWHGLVVLGLTAAASLTILAEPAIELVYGSDFLVAGSVLGVLAWLLPIRFLNNLCAVTLNATAWNRNQTLAFGAIISANVLANLALIPVFGYWGAVYAALAAETGLLAILLVSVRTLRPPLLAPLSHGAVVAAATAATVAFTPGHVLLRTAAGAAVTVLLFGSSMALLRRTRALRSSRRDDSGTTVPPSAPPRSPHAWHVAPTDPRGEDG